MAGNTPRRKAGDATASTAEERKDEAFIVINPTPPAAIAVAPSKTPLLLLTLTSLLQNLSYCRQTLRRPVEADFNGATYSANED